MATEAAEAFGPSNVNCCLSSLGAGVVMVDNWNQHPQGYPLWGNLLDDET